MPVVSNILVVLQNELDIELFLRRTIGNPASHDEAAKMKLSFL
jgi:hypothetical protein